MKRQTIKFCGVPMTVMGWRSDSVGDDWLAEITCVDVCIRLYFNGGESRVMPEDVVEVGCDGMVTMKDGTSKPVVYMDHEDLPATEAMNHRDKLRSDAPQVDVAAVIEQTVERVAPQTIEDQMRASVAVVNRTQTLNPLEKEVFRYHAEGVSLSGIAARVHRAGLTKREYTKAAISKILDRIVSKEPALRPAIKGRVSKREAYRQDQEDRGSFERHDRAPKSSDAFYRKVDE